MKKIIRLIVIISFILICLGCGNDDSNITEIPPVVDSKDPEQIYYTQGFEAFKDYVLKNNYFILHDKNKREATPLLLAIKYKDIDTIKLFIDKGASWNEKDIYGLDAVDYILATFDVDFISTIIELIPIEYWERPSFNDRLTYFKLVSNINNTDIISRIIKNIANINYSDSNQKTLLMYAAQVNTEVLVTKLLLDNGADINLKNKNEWTAAMYAARYNPNPLVLEYLILNGADLSPNSVGLTLTMLAACNPNKGVLITLLRYLKETDSQTDNGKTALMYALENRVDIDIIKILLDEKADVNLSDKDGKNALMYALENNADDGIIKILREQTSDKP